MKQIKTGAGRLWFRSAAALPVTLVLAGSGLILAGCGGSSAQTPAAISGGVEQPAPTLVGGGAGEGADAGGDAASQAASQCNALAGAAVGGANLKRATLVAATATAVEACVVEGSLHGTLNFRIALPTHWNGRLLTLGGGGWNGSIPAAARSASGNSGGYVIVASDGGRQGDGLDASAFLDSAQARQDFGYLSSHSSYEVAMALVVRHYGREPVYRYFEGCSNGGREALVQATRFPHDYDGIVVRAPAYSFTELFQHFVAIGQALNAPGGHISDAKAGAIAKAALEACDADDGVVDGLVSHPEACTFKPASLGCDVSDSEFCLSEGELKTAKVIYSPLTKADSTPVYPGWAAGGEDLGWPTWVTGTAVNGVGRQFGFGTGLIKYWLTEDPDFDVLSFDPELYRPELALAAATLDAGKDLSTFFGRGGRMILVHGTHDWAISYKGSIEYFNQTARASGGEAVRDEAMEFFLQPGVQHCSGGVGPDTVDLVSAVSTWVEAGIRPSDQGMVATRVDAATQTVTLGRPLCRYPAFPKYSGSGDPADPASFTCQLN